MAKNSKEPVLFCDAASGIYIPQRFATEVRREAVSGIDLSLLDALAEGPEREDYWDIWYDVLNEALVTDQTTGITYTLWGADDLWLLPLGYDGPLLNE